MKERIFYHVAGSDYGVGEDLYCFDELEAMGYPVEWKWDGDPVDTDVVCLFETLDEARELQEDKGGIILRITLPDDIHTVTVSEGYPAVFTSISSEFIEEATR